MTFENLAAVMDEHQSPPRLQSPFAQRGRAVMGTRHSGEAGYRLANVPNFESLLATARNDATLLLDKDPQLATERGTAVRTLLYFFEQDEAVRLLRAW